MTEQDEALIAILAATDAVFLPARDHRSPRWVATWRARAAYRLGGLPLPGGGDAAARKDHQRQLERLEVAELVLLSRPRGARGPHVRLTDGADWYTRALCGLPGRSEALVVVDELVKRTKPGGKRIRDVWVPESDLADVKDKNSLMSLEDAALPGLVRGWALSLCSTRRLAYYAPTMLGRAAVLSAGGDFEEDKDLPARDEEAREHYYGLLNRATDGMENPRDRDRDRDVGPIPLPASISNIDEIGPWEVPA